MNPWDYTFGEDPITKRQYLDFGEDLRAKATGSRWPLDWCVYLKAAKDLWFMPDAAPIVVASGLIAQTQRDFYAERIGEFDITSALREAVEAETPEEIAHIGARLAHARRELEIKIDRTKNRT